jgi:hypothetical protein
MNNSDLLEHCLQVVKLYAQCSRADADLLPLLDFSESEKAKYQKQIFQVVLQQIVFLHDRVTTSEDWGQLTHRLLMSGYDIDKAKDVNKKLKKLLETLLHSLPTTELKE